VRGKILSYDDLNGTGLISGDDGTRYAFTRGDIQGGPRTAYSGQEVDFSAVENRASDIYITSNPNVLAGEKNKIVAALLAIFLGLFGAHKFYLGRMWPGIIMLLCGTLGWFLFAIPPIIISVIAFIEFIIYLVKPDAEFHRDYVVGNRSWF